MNKKKLKEAFDKEFNNITVSNELKQKTLNAVEVKQNQKSLPLPYLRNFAAVFIDSLLCLSIYIVKNTPQKENITFDKSNLSNETILEESENLNSNIPELTRAINTENAAPSTDLISFDTMISNSTSSTETPPTLYSSGASTLSNALQKKSQLSTPNLQKETITALSEDEFIKQHPNAEKVDNGYIIHENEKETVYIFNNKVLENIIIID